MNINSFFNSNTLTNMVNNKGVQNFVSDLGNETKLLQVGLLETSVQSGRSYQAQKRGGYYELKETFLEGLLAAAIWLGGIKILNRSFDEFSKRILKIDTTIDWKQVPKLAEGRLNPAKFISRTVASKSTKLLFSIVTSIYTVGVLVPKYKQKLTRESIERENKANAVAQKRLDALKISSTGELPKNFKALDLGVLKNSNSHGIKFEGVQDNTNQINPVKLGGGSAPSFTGAFNILSKLGHALENETIPQLAVLDTGITGGRIINARNADEAIEITFRDFASSFFYYFCIPGVTAILSKSLDAKLGIHSSIDPKVLDTVTNEFKNQVTQLAKKGPVSLKDLQKVMLGLNNETIANVIVDSIGNKAKVTPQEIQKILSRELPHILKSAETTAARNMQEYVKAVSARAISVAKSNTNASASKELLKLGNLMSEVAKSPAGKDSAIQSLLKDSDLISKELYAKVKSGKDVDKAFIDKISKLFTTLKASKLDKPVLDKVDELAKLVMENLNGTGYVTKEALEEVLKGGLSRDSKFIQKMLAESFMSGKGDKMYSAVLDPKKYIDPREFASVKDAFAKYAQRVITQLEREGVIKEGQKVNIQDVEQALDKTLKTTKNKNLIFKFGYLIAGLAVGITFLSYIIPKAQYLITKMRTGNDAFPGVAGLLDDGKPKVKTDQKANGSQPVEIAVNKPESIAFNNFLNQYMKESNIQSK